MLKFYSLYHRNFFCTYNEIYYEWISLISINIIQMLIGERHCRNLKHSLSILYNYDCSSFCTGSHLDT